MNYQNGVDVIFRREFFGFSASFFFFGFCCFFLCFLFTFAYFLRFLSHSFLIKSSLLFAVALKALLRWLLRLLLFGAHWCYCAEAGMSYKLLRERRLFVSTFKSIITVSFYMEQAKQVRDITRKETCPTTCRLLRACQNTVQSALCRMRGSFRGFWTTCLDEFATCHLKHGSRMNELGNLPVQIQCHMPPPPFFSGKAPFFPAKEDHKSIGHIRSYGFTY